MILKFRPSFRRVLSLLISFYLLLPLFLLFFSLGVPHFSDGKRVFSSLNHILLQASLSTFLSLFMGFVMALGLFSLKKSWLKFFFENWILIPVWIPSFFVLIGVLNFCQNLFLFPFGMMGVVLLHVIMMSGLCAISLVQIIQSQWCGQLELAWIEGASRWFFFRRAGWSQIKGPTGTLALVIFAMSFTSFTIPLVVGGVKSSSLEVFIYQQFHLGKDLDQALALLLIEIVFLIVVSLFIRHPIKKNISHHFNQKYLSWRPGLFFVFLNTAIVLMGLLGVGKTSWSQLQQWPQLGDMLIKGLFWSFLIVFFTGVFVVGLQCLILMALPLSGFRKFLLGFSAPSGVMIGVALLVFEGSQHWMGLLKLIVAFTLIMTPVLYRWMVDQKFHSLVYQIEISQTMGASWSMIWKRIVFPQMAVELGQVAGVSSLWASGDYALSNMLLDKTYSYTQLLSHFMNSYRIELATLLLWPLLIMGLFFYFLWLGVGYVLSGKSFS
ncbi:MAG: ABC transporter permease subunit [Bdellovibrionales bacterium]|nr:ABC transporter permease subunit [Bdellovibrionales bacterium]